MVETGLTGGRTHGRNWSDGRMHRRTKRRTITSSSLCTTGLEEKGEGSDLNMGQVSDKLSGESLPVDGSSKTIPETED